MYSNNIGTLIRDARIKKGYSQKDLAGLLHVSTTAVCKWEKGVNLPDKTNITNICDALNIPIYDFFTADSSDKSFQPECELQKTTKDNNADTASQLKFYRTVILILFTGFVIIGIGVLVLYFNTLSPSFKIIDSFYGDMADTLFFDDAYCIVVKCKDDISENDYKTMNEYIRQEYNSYFEEVDAILIMYFNTYDAAIDSINTAQYFTFLLPLPPELENQKEKNK